MSHEWKDDPRLLSYLLDELSVEERGLIDAALAEGDEALAAELAGLEAFLPQLRGAVASRSVQGAELSEGARTAIHEAAAEAQASPGPRMGLAVKVLAAAAIVMIIVGVLRPRPWSTSDSAAPSALGYEIGGPVSEWRPTIEVAHTGKMIITKGSPASNEAALRALGYSGNDGPTSGANLRSIGYLGDHDVVIESVRPSIEDNPFVPTEEDRLSTFSIDVDTASYALARAKIEQGSFPQPDEVRAEEFINYFSYGDAPPAQGSAHPVAITADVGAAPWMPEHRLVRIGLAAERIEFEERAPANLVFLVDVSGSMSNSRKLPLVVKALALLTESLAPDDRIAIVVYARSEGLVLDSTPIAAREAILQALESLNAGGSTNGGAGIQLAYSVAREHFVEEGVNRVVLCTDGDFNVGMTSDEALEDLIATESAGGVDLTLLGFGGGRYRDGMMEKLSNRGNGNFAFIDSMQEAQKVLAREVAGTLVTVARDTKIQVEWNSDLVQSVRQIGYENRQLEHADFANDAIDAGEMGAGHVVTALFEVVPQPGALLAGGADLGEVRVRYKRPNSDASELMTTAIRDGGATFGEAPEALRFSAAAAAFAMVLRGSPYVGDTGLRDVRGWALEAAGSDPGALRAGFIDLLQQAIKLKPR